MTIVAGFHVNDGILICSDTQYTGAAKVYQQKVFPMTVDGDTYVFGLAGHEPNGKMAIEDCQEAIQDLPAEQRSLKGIKRALRKAVKPICDEYVLSRPTGDQDGVAFEIMVGCWIARGGGHKLFSISRNGAVNRLDGYGCIGVGSYLGDYFIRQIFRRQMTVDTVLLLAAQTLNAVKSYDQNCGGPSQLVIIDKNGHHAFLAPESPWILYFLSTYDAIARQLMFAIADEGLSAPDFDMHLQQFIKQVGMFRTESLRQSSLGGSLNPLPTTAYQSPRPPSPESLEGSDES
ncbi:MAG TPA: hypothetical protein VN924_24675 [Bryobacteraceae bacterium]|nr:hypothetical protein [Bryobacteraceae bacterium]